MTHAAALIVATLLLPASASRIAELCAPLLPTPVAACECRVTRLKVGNTNTLSCLEVAGERYLVREFGTQAALQLDRNVTVDRTRDLSIRRHATATRVQALTAAAVAAKVA